MSEKLSEYIGIIEKALTEFNPQLDDLQKNIYKSMNYSLSAGGKRMRPVLLLEFNRICGGNLTEALPFACALEMIHTYSLIHDDLPAMDNDDLRRGNPTNHIVFGEATAILAGDALLTQAFNIMSSAPLKDKAKIVEAIWYIADAAGTQGMIGGQIVDIESEGKKVDIDVLRYIHRLKTGALIRAACVVGAIVAGADEKTLNLVSNYADNLGIAFQIRDDILDVCGDVSTLGKPIGSDEKSQKSTYVSLLGVDEAKGLCNEYTNKALECLEELSGDTKFLMEFTSDLAIRNN